MDYCNNSKVKNDLFPIFIKLKSCIIKKINKNYIPFKKEISLIKEIPPMEINDHIKISKITGEKIYESLAGGYYSIIWIRGTVEGIQIDDTLCENISNTMFFLAPKHQWKIFNCSNLASKGYALYLSDTILNEPFLSRLQINEIRVLHSDTIHRAQIAPGIEMRLLSILEMLDELVTTHLNHREDAILALINTFFVYCDGQCNVKLSNCAHNNKTALVYKFVRVLSEKVTEIQKVSQYAAKLNVSSTYLNECTHQVLGLVLKV